MWETIITTTTGVLFGWLVGRKKENSDISSTDNQTWSARFDQQDKIIKELQHEYGDIHRRFIELQKMYYNLYGIAITYGWSLPTESGANTFRNGDNIRNGSANDNTGEGRDNTANAKRRQRRSNNLNPNATTPPAS